MKLYDYLSLMTKDDELTVWDKDYDIEIYFYNSYNNDGDKWDEAIRELSKILTIVQIKRNGVIVDLADVIEKKIDKLAGLFISCNIDNIMDDIPNIMAGYVSEKWMCEFIDILVE